ncbi:hypothetical protein AAFC00_004603 [Neodothiora populina]|uniref:Amino-acid acetyltransferase, mitochondrial n=1 Tax=Neodothiora populina TaxID=2781224 RepID=A0ABR3P3Y0_9PEZI
MGGQDFFFDILSSSTTRRDAKQYLARFKSREKDLGKTSPPPKSHHGGQEDVSDTGVNLGGLYLPTRAAASSPTFTRSEKDIEVQRGFGEVHVALVSMRSPYLIEDDVLDGIALTLAQLVRLDMQIVLAIDCHEEISLSGDRSFKHVYQQQGERVVAAIERHNNAGARYVDSAMTIQDQGDRDESLAQVQGNVAVEIPKLILEPLKRGAIPVIPAIAHTSTFRASHVSAAEIMLALTRLLSDIATDAQKEAAIDASLDRIIMLEPMGGLPSEQREDRAHVFINLEQEYEDVAAELQDGHAAAPHAANLKLLRDCLMLLPPASSALLISPEEAASVSRSTKQPDAIGITTRRQKNPLIHNLLTNKPIISSSLPVARLPAVEIYSAVSTQASPTRSTLVKRGMPLTIIPDPRKQPWLPPKPGEKTISLDNHPNINLPRLVDLIEDSFRRPLDVRHYLQRIENRIAGVIIAGEYEGGAILTWEMPPNLSSQSSDPDEYDPSRLVPYLDKFAVLQKSQGSSGVADVVFQAMVRSCFPHGVCWRSRKTNPVNKWYFERSKGTWDLTDTQWTMFWTGDGVVESPERWQDYLEVCRSIPPSWDDNKAPD